MYITNHAAEKMTEINGTNIKGNIDTGKRLPFRFRPAALWILVALLLAACGGGPGAASPAELAGFSAEEVATLRSLEQVDDHPLYVMRYSGPYRPRQTGLDQSPASAPPFACSLFAALGQPGDRLYGRNFDWDFSPALLLFTDPPDGYASLSLVDLTFLGIDPDGAKSLADLPLAERAALLGAPWLPFDGMNEYGLAIGMAAVPESSDNDGGYDPARPDIGSIGVIREVLDHARNVEEAVALFGQYNIAFSGGPPIHYLVADAAGQAVLVELYQGELVVLPNKAGWHLATNHLRCTASGDGGCPRYHRLFERLAKTGGRLDELTALALLSEVAQGSTQWSVVYNLTGGDVSVVVGRAYDTIHRFHLDRAE